MKYFLRALKAFVYFCVFFIILTLVLYYGRVVPAMSYTDMFEEGALWQILAYFVVFAAIYPIFGYNKVEMFIDGGYDGNADKIRDIMAEYGYELVSEDETCAVFRHRSVFTRIIKMGSSKIYFYRQTGSNGSTTMEGLRKDVSRFARSIEFRLGKDKEKTE